DGRFQKGDLHNTTSWSRRGRALAGTGGFYRRRFKKPDTEGGFPGDAPLGQGESSKRGLTSCTAPYKNVLQRTASPAFVPEYTPDPGPTPIPAPALLPSLRGLEWKENVMKKKNTVATQNVGSPTGSPTPSPTPTPTPKAKVRQRETTYAGKL